MVKVKLHSTPEMIRIIVGVFIVWDVEGVLLDTVPCKLIVKETKGALIEKRRQKRIKHEGGRRYE